MNRAKSIFLPVFALIVIAFYSCENDVKEVDTILKKQTGVEEAKKVQAYMSEGGKVKAKLSSPFMLRYMTDSPYVEFPRKLHVDFFNDSVVIETTLDALYAKYTEYQQKVFLRDSVIVINSKTRDTLKAQELWWDQNKKEFYTDKPAETHSANGNILYSSKGLRAAQDLSWKEFYGNTGQMKVSESGGLE